MPVTAASTSRMRMCHHWTWLSTPSQMLLRHRVGITPDQGTVGPVKLFEFSAESYIQIELAGSGVEMVDQLYTVVRWSPEGKTSHLLPPFFRLVLWSNLNTTTNFLPRRPYRKPWSSNVRTRCLWRARKSEYLSQAWAKRRSWLIKTPDIGMYWTLLSRWG